MIKIKNSKSFEKLNTASDEYIIVKMQHKTATPRAIMSNNSHKHARHVAKRLNAIVAAFNIGNYPRYIGISRAACYYGAQR